MNHVEIALVRFYTHRKGPPFNDGYRRKSEAPLQGDLHRASSLERRSEPDSSPLPSPRA
jgi:hypothetical protein